MPDKRIGEMVDELADAARFEGSELGEWWEMLTDLYPDCLDMASNKFVEAYKEQIKSEWEHLSDNFKWVEEEVRPRKLRRLVSKDE